jgi:uncharacterized protein YkwD
VALSRRALLLTLAALPLSARTAAAWCAPRLADRVDEIEWHIQFLTNQQRIWAHVAKLEPSPPLATIARAHSQDMLTRKFFGHVNPDGLNPKDRVQRAGLHHAYVAENVYSTRNGSSDAAEAASVIVTGWMNSSGHRRNILDPKLTLLGVGVAADDDEILATQLFAG